MTDQFMERIKALDLATFIIKTKPIFKNFPKPTKESIELVYWVITQMYLRGYKIGQIEEFLKE